MRKRFEATRKRSGRAAMNRLIRFNAAAIARGQFVRHKVFETANERQ